MMSKPKKSEEEEELDKFMKGSIILNTWAH
jgi:hypothetical protein